MPPTVVTIQYLGVVRLLLGKKEDVLEFAAPPNLAAIQTTLSARYGESIAQACRQQTFLYYPPDTTTGQVISPQDPLVNNSVLKIASLVTGG